MKAAGRSGVSAEPTIREVLNLTRDEIGSALRYYAAYPDEIDAEITARDAGSRAAEQECQGNHPLRI